MDGSRSRQDCCKTANLHVLVPAPSPFSTYRVGGFHRPDYAPAPERLPPPVLSNPRFFPLTDKGANSKRVPRANCRNWPRLVNRQIQKISPTKKRAAHYFIVPAQQAIPDYRDVDCSSVCPVFQLEQTSQKRTLPALSTAFHSSKPSRASYGQPLEPAPNGSNLLLVKQLRTHRMGSQRPTNSTNHSRPGNAAGGLDSGGRPSST